MLHALDNPAIPGMRANVSVRIPNQGGATQRTVAPYLLRGTFNR